MTDHLDIIKTSATVIAKRRETYGPPTDCFARASMIATAMLGRKVSSYEIALIFHAMKLARIAQSPENLDHYVDGVSYLAFAGEFGGAGKEDARRDTKALAPAREYSPLPGVINTVADPRIAAVANRTIDEAAATVGGRPVVPLRGDPKSNG